MSKPNNIIAFLLFAVFFISHGIALVDKTIHTSVVGAARLDLLSLAEKEIPIQELGDWPETIEAALFMTLRKTELYRGPLRAMVIRDERIIASLYPEGTFVLSSGLLDFIDGQLFEDLALGTKRIRNPELERENLFIPLIITEISRFAASSQIEAWNRSFSSRGGPQNQGNLFTILKPTADDIFIADRFSLLLLSVAGYNTTIFTDSLKRLNAESSSPNISKNLKEYLSSFPTAQARIQAIINSGNSPERLIGEVSNILLSVKTGIALSEAVTALDQLLLDYPTSSYFLRLKALLSHRIWIQQNGNTYNQLPTLFPVADEARALEILFTEKDILNSYTLLPSETIRDKKNWVVAQEAYAKVLSLYSDPSLESSYARLLAFSAVESDKTNALQIAEQAALKEAGSGSLIARANYASLLVSLSKDTDKAIFIFTSIIQPNRFITSKQSLQISSGFPIYSADIKKNFIICLIALGEKEQARNLIRQEEINKEKELLEALSVRSISFGDTTDTLLERWGHPSEIVFNYFTETWVYKGLDTSVLMVANALDSKTPLKVLLIRLNSISPISLGDSIRVGDSREDFENYFGKPDFKASDSDVYTLPNTQIFVLYINNKIRSMTIQFREH